MTVISSLQGSGDGNLFHHVEHLTNLTMSAVVVRNQEDPFMNTVYDELHPYLENYTEHFCHELFNYERSPFNMINYDEMVYYSFREAPDVRLINITN